VQEESGQVAWGSATEYGPPCMLCFLCSEWGATQLHQGQDEGTQTGGI
jgi:hypothetical protein